MNTTPLWVPLLVAALGLISTVVGVVVTQIMANRRDRAPMTRRDRETIDSERGVLAGVRRGALEDGAVPSIGPVNELLDERLRAGSTDFDGGNHVGQQRHG